MKSKIHEKGYRNQPLTKSQMRSNRAKSRIRVWVEHVFAHITNCVNGFAYPLDRNRASAVEHWTDQFDLQHCALRISSGGVSCPGIQLEG